MEGEGGIWARERACGTPHTFSHAPKFPLPLSTLATQAIPDRTSVHTQDLLWRRDFCDGAKLRRADLESGASNIGEVLYHTLMRCEHLVTLKRNKKNCQEATEMLSALQIQGLDLKNPHLH